MAAVISFEHVTKQYGTSRGVSDISLEIAQGSVFGFLGPNGAGKTTTINMLVDLIRPTSGLVQVFGLDAQRDGKTVRQRIGFLAGDFALDNGLTGWQQLEYFGNLRGNFHAQYVRELAERLDCHLDKPFKTLSRGNRQKIGLISALMHQPELLILDEPTSGLDPLIQAEFNKIIVEHQQQGKTVFISSHSLSEVQALCQQVGFIREGELIAVKKLDELMLASAKHVRLVAHDQKVPSVLHELKQVTQLSHSGDTTKFVVRGDLNPILLVLSRFKIDDIIITEADLDAIFMQYYEESSDV
ncbi:MAG: ABC transporter ATP-binding protein [Candidatus Saccharimonadales bacterium]